MHKKILFWAAILGATAVAIGAFGTHNLKTRLEPKYLEIFQTGVQYHFYHVLALLITGLLYRSYRHIHITAAAYFFVLGIIFFSFSLYIYVLTSLIKKGPVKIFASLTPVGGLFFILGWVMLAVYFSKDRSTPKRPKNDE